MVKTHNNFNFISISLNDLKEDFLLSLKAKHKSMKTIATYRYPLDRFLKFLKNKRISKIQNVNIQHIEKYQLELIEDGMESVSRDLYIRAIKLFFTFLEDRGIIFINPTEEIKKIKIIKKLKDFPTVEEMNLLLKQPNISTNIGIRDRAIIETAYSGALRISELISIKLYDVDLRSGLIKINGKGSKERTVPIGKHATDWIDRYIKEVRPLLVKDNINENHLWIGHNSNKINLQTVQVLIRKYKNQANIKSNITVHSIRRACATHMLQNGAHPSQIQILLGHSSLKHLSQYLRLTITEIKEMHKKSKVGK